MSLFTNYVNTCAVTAHLQINRDDLKDAIHETEEDAKTPFLFGTKEAASI